MQTQGALLWESDGPFRIESIELPDPTPDQVIVRVAGVGVCHTDLLVREMPGLAPFPFLGGHEGAGIVEAIGDDVTEVEVGDHVVLSFDSCGRCDRCRRGHPAHCSSFPARNFGGGVPPVSIRLSQAPWTEVRGSWFGQSSFAAHALATERNVTRVDRSLPIEILGPLACGVLTGAGAVLCATKVPFGSSVAVFGAGAVGLAAVMAAQIAGAAKIVAVDLHSQRLELAAELGATDLVNSSALEGPEELAKAIGSVDFSFETTGVVEVVHAALRCLDFGGVLGVIAYGRAELAVSDMGRRTVTGINLGDAIPQVFIPQLIELWQAGRFPFDRMIKTFPLAEINEAEQAVHKGEVIKAVLLP